ncbi:MAG: hypothetical protein K8W52_40820 [Deltaproteobacteria bacterium]|nr:hypothetical protein [Deltaproteobacteria bacterium]
MGNRIVVALLALVVLASVAHAAPDPHLKAALAQLKVQTAAIARDDDAAFVATLTPDAMVSLGRPQPERGPTRIAWGFVASAQKITIARTRTGWQGTWGWVAADLRVTTLMHAEAGGAGDPAPTPTTDSFHWVSVVVADGAAVKTRAVFLSEAVPDDNLIGYDDQPALAKDAGQIASLLARPKALAAQLAASPDLAAFGSSEAERALGAPAVKKLVGSWKNLDLIQVGDTAEVIQGDLAFAFADVAMKLKRTPNRIVLHGFVIARKGASGWEVVAVSYSGNF